MPPTFLGIPRALQAVIVLGLATVGASLGWFLPWIADWALGLPIAPFRFVLRAIDSAPAPWFSIGAAVIGLIAGVLLGVAAIEDSLELTVTDQQVELKIDGDTRTFGRSQIGSAFMDGKRLVLLDPQTRELAREKPEVSAEKVAAGFRSHGYPWADADPYLAGYRLWVPDLPGLPDGANALLSARARAIEKDRGDDVAALRQELAALGLVVRDDGDRQYWRRIPQLSSEVEPDQR